ncbi:MAG: hypothetical protein HFACDABA_00296 [Anaerolineales bacterium]|nr:hypothetical protein [Anaerolineales bacterium]
MITTLQQIESRIRELVEVRLPAILPGKKMAGDTIPQLAAAMHANILEKAGRRFAPHAYTLITRPDEGAHWQDPNMLEMLCETIQTTGRESGLEFAAPPILTLATDDALSPQHIRITASHHIEPLGETSDALNEQASPDNPQQHIPENAFLILDGRKVLPISEIVINIGRRLENNIVLDDPRISRSHSQLRAIKGRYVIFDLDSTGGTYVNGQRIQQTILYPGDVISLAGITLVFGQDNPPPRPDLRETGPLVNQAPERPTAILKDRTDLRRRRK